MSGYGIPKRRLNMVQDAVAALEGASRAVLTTHVNADGDGVGSQVALLSFLEERGAKAWILNPSPISEVFRFMMPDSGRVLDAASDEAAIRSREADLCVVVDTGETSRIGRVRSLVRHLPTLVIDHHPVGDDPIGGVSFRDTRAAAAGELVFDLLWAAGGPWTRAVADGLYVALMTDTGSFRFSNVTPGVHRVVAELVERGADPDRLYRQIYGKVPMRRIKLLSTVLPTLDVSPDGRVAWLSLSARALRESGCSSDDLEGMVDYPRDLEGVEVGLLFRELDDGQVKISLRSNGYVDVNALARSLGGGGHVRASGALVAGSLEEVRERVVALAVASAAENGEAEVPDASGPSSEP
jgi:phosphoesterase RecJ-like protein